MSGRLKPTYPVQLRLVDMPVLVVGAGVVAHRKVERLLEAGARVTVVAPTADPRLVKLAASGRITLAARDYLAGETAEYRLVVCATGVPEVERLVAADAEHSGTFINVADVPDLCSFYLPALVRRGRLQISISTDGAAPFAAKRLRQRLQGRFGDSWEQWLETAAAFREAVLDRFTDPQLRDRLFDRFIDETLPDDGPPDIPAELSAETWQRWLDEAH